MIQGTMSNAGKSLIAAGLCRIFRQDGYSVAPFKSQNMALNSCVTREGLEMGRAQAVQAEAAGIAPDVRMNPILLKPTTDMGSQVIVMGRPAGNMGAAEYFRKKREYIPVIREAYSSLAAEHDIIVIEGAGSPAEINLRADDIVNMGMAEIADAPVLLVGDIDRGGVFAQLYGTVALLTEEERARVRGLIINKFRGDRALLDPGVRMIEELTGKKVVGVVPYADVRIEDEDSLADGLRDRTGAGTRPRADVIDTAVVRLPRISNFTDFQVLETEESVSLRYVRSAEELGNPDLVILPGTKSTISDLLWLRSSGLEAGILRLAERGVPVFGICGGYQMLGTSVADPGGVESPGLPGGLPGGEVRGLDLLPVRTVFSGNKITSRAEGTVLDVGIPGLSGTKVSGYLIHMGREFRGDGVPAFSTLRAAEGEAPSPDGAARGRVFGTYLHGIFDGSEFREAFLGWLASEKGIGRENRAASYREFKEAQYDALAEVLRESLDMDEIRRIIGTGGATRD